VAGAGSLQLVAPYNFVMKALRDWSQLISRMLVGVFLFAQLAVSGHACPVLAQADPHAVEMPSQQADAMPPGCGELEHKAPNLCAEHCKLGQQSSDTAPLPVVLAPALNLLYVLAQDLQTGDGPAPPGASIDPRLAAAPPPHAILHCVLRI
jgi:hypothetical protein